MLAPEKSADKSTSTVKPCVSVGKRKGFCFFKLQPSAACHFSAAKSTSADLTSRTAIDLYTPSVCDSSAGRASVDGSFPYGLRRAHGALNVFAWGVLMPVGAILARYFRRVDPLWFYLHVGIQFVGFIIGLAGVVAGVALYNKIQADIPAHRGLGIFVLFLGILQVRRLVQLLKHREI